MNLSLKEAIGRRASGRAGSRVPSGSLAAIEIAKGADGIARPVDVARLLTAFGASLDQAHAMLEQIAAGECLQISVETSRIDDARSRFAALGVESRRLPPAQSMAARTTP